MQDIAYLEIKNMEQRATGKQIALWAYELTIMHPITKEEKRLL